MSQKIQRVDELGFPVPHTFESIQPIDRSSSSPAADQRPSRLARVLRFTLVLVGLGLFVGLLFKEQGRRYMAAMHTHKAQEKFLNDDLSGAVAELDRALLWMPDSPEAYRLRALYKQEASDLQGSLEDYKKLVQLRPDLPEAYVGRSVVYQRQEMHRRAIDDLTKAIELQPNSDHVLLNHRAYTRAIAKMELDEALEDIQQAIQLAGGEVAAYIDTRGYIYYLLDRQEEALADLDRALELAEEQRQETRHVLALRRIDPRKVARVRRMLDESEGVMTYHRGLVHEKLGHAELALADKRRGEQLGYNPANGVY